MDTLSSLRAIIEEIPRDQLPEAAARLAEAQAALQLRLQKNGTAPKPPSKKPDSSDSLLTVSEAADMLGVDERWIYRRSDRLPFVRRLGPRTLRLSEAGIRRWLETRKGAP